MKPAGRRSAEPLRTCLIYVISVLAVAAHASCRKAAPTPELEGGRLKESVEAQKTINRYFQDVVIPKLKPCWDRLQGTGTIEMTFAYVKAAEGWANETVEAGESSLSPEQRAAAAKCMQEAVQGTSLPIPSRGSDESYALHWSWPVPLPANAEEQFAEMQKDNGGGLGSTGCDGHGAAAKCVTCAGQPLSCIAVCVGGKPPCTMTENPLPGGFSRTCTVGTGCASGGLFGVVGGALRF
jgi:hypothetical protein